MQNTPQTFNNPTLGASLRVIEIDGEPFFVAQDVCRVLGYAVRHNGTVNVSHLRTILNPDETFTSLTGKTGRPSLIISESGLYKLIMRSDKPVARPFQDWVTREVLPAIRKDGGYQYGQEKVVTGEMSEEELVLEAMKTQERRVERLLRERDQAVEQATTLRTCVGASEHTLNRFARTLPGVNLSLIKERLYKLGFLYRSGRTYKVYRKFSHLFQERIHDIYGTVQIFPTEAGKEKLLMLYREGCLPLKKAT